jgi:hypothetical protein
MRRDPLLLCSLLLLHCLDGLGFLPSSGPWTVRCRGGLRLPCSPGRGVLVGQARRSGGAGDERADILEAIRNLTVVVGAMDSKFETMESR